MALILTYFVQPFLLPNLHYQNTTANIEVSNRQTTAAVV